MLKPIILIFCSVFLLSCQKDQVQQKQVSGDTTKTVSGIYRFNAGKRDIFSIWIVDGAAVRREIFSEFLFGGNSERYQFIPEDEIWVDNAVTSEELETTIVHEINERNLMYKSGWTYFDAHDSSLALEVELRKKFRKDAEAHESGLKPVSPTDFDSTLEIESLPEKIKLKNIYRQYIGKRDSIDIWIVDGVNVRRDIYPDFGFSGNDLAYHFIPEKEIWIDAQVSCEEMEYSIKTELIERKNIASGQYYDDAFSSANKFVTELRKKNYKEYQSYPPIKITNPLYRDTGTGRK